MPATEVYFVLSSFVLGANCLFASFILCTQFVGARMHQVIKQKVILVLVATTSFTLLGSPLGPLTFVDSHSR